MRRLTATHRIEPTRPFRTLGCCSFTARATYWTLLRYRDIPSYEDIRDCQNTRGYRHIPLQGRLIHREQVFLGGRSRVEPDGPLLGSVFGQLG